MYKPSNTVYLFLAITLLCVVTTTNALRKPKAPLIYPMSSNVTNVHIVAHTHDDVGWLKTVDQYYVGLNMSIAFAGVQYTLDEVIMGLLQNANRRFIYVEIAYFMRWWNEQTPELQEDVTELVHNGQLEFINGGWCMNDEATTYYDDIIDQMTLGHQFLNQKFGVTPKIGWHIDPFGHSSAQAALFANLGFEAFFICRLDYQDDAIRLADKRMEFIWNGTQSTPQYQLFTGVLRNHYCTPSGFSFEDGDDPIQNDPTLFNYNVQQRAEEFVAMALEYASHYTTNNVLIPFGCDFAYIDANLYFKNIDKLIAYINANPQYGINVFYSTPSIYTNAVNEAGVSFSVKTDDFFPYADNEYSYWTGYFVSRPALKGYVRQTNALLHVAEQLLVTSQSEIPSVQSTYFPQVEVLRQAQGVAQHHDAVSGTEKQEVAWDYAMRLSIGQYAVYEALDSVVGQLLVGSGNQSVPSMQFCPLLNESSCPALTQLAQGTNVPVVLYNSLSWSRFEHVRLPVPTATVYVSNEYGAVSSQTTTEQDGTISLSFTAEVPPFGFASYVLSTSAPQDSEAVHAEAHATAVTAGDIVMQNAFISVSFDGKTGAIKSITNVTSGSSIAVTQEYLMYDPSTGDHSSGQCSGAYIFRPVSQTPSTYTTTDPKVTYAPGSMVSTLTRYWNANMIQTFRLYANAYYLELEETVGPISIADNKGKEVISRYTTDLHTNNLWYSDANGMEMQERELNKRYSWNYTVVQPVSGNYVPVNAITYLQDTTKNQQLTFVTDRSRSCASLSDGEIEMMLHRRTLRDDGRGVGEPMNESTQIVTTTKIVFHGINNDAQSMYRPLSLEHNHPLFPVFTTTQQSPSVWSSQYRGTYSPLALNLPAGVRVHTLQWLDGSDTSIILRLQNIYELDGQDTVDPQLITLDASTLFSTYSVTSITEMNLSATLKLSSFERLSWKTNTGTWYPNNGSLDNFTVQLTPMDVRTFIITLESSI
ncbi:hypothetical protein SAMD00019534_026970 [Acytostelium subglobosum LB1]|uniref:hypothetical protein n=1 Tax=Acytostelium subglobosum LB1 TaxID=1410327 RepID=UPI0006451929|nr:hypothetical protein SAMD00019534_026970 [Acytostelium subglobosum LB1]GAM19522.1 hypothetical protein SAMD00019534_026970 [Acytostelium subglobosum LB1]|eukprot:XP_012757449.1 hypothetical protein SAMD00019534_026970 [Acytostelium subglobosum LB1]